MQTITLDDMLYFTKNQLTTGIIVKEQRDEINPIVTHYCLHFGAGIIKTDYCIRLHYGERPLFEKLLTDYQPKTQIDLETV